MAIISFVVGLLVMFAALIATAFAGGPPLLAYLSGHPITADFPPQGMLDESWRMIRFACWYAGTGLSLLLAAGVLALTASLIKDGVQIFSFSYWRNWHQR